MCINILLLFWRIFHLAGNIFSCYNDAREKPKEHKKEENEMSYTQASRRAVDKYQKANMEQIALRYQKSLGFKDALQSHAKLTGESMAAFVLRACRETMERDKAQITQMMKDSRK